MMRQRKQASVLPLHNNEITAATSTNNKPSSSSFVTRNRHRRGKSSTNSSVLKSVVICMSLTILMAYGLWKIVSMAFFETSQSQSNLSFVQQFRQRLNPLWGGGRRHHHASRILCRGLYTPNRMIFATVNDNFCDCLDGQDETATSACSHILAAQPIFDCEDNNNNNNNSSNEQNTHIMASRVGDGVVDCPNGRDER